MNICKNILLFCFVILTVNGCDIQESSNASNEEQLSFNHLNGNSFLFVVEKEIARAITDGFTIDDSLYVNIEDGDEYIISFSSNCQHVVIEPTKLSGFLVSEENEKLEYTIKYGYFAGGQFSVWIDRNIFKAELTEYGSGVHIVASRKGSLILSK